MKKLMTMLAAAAMAFGLYAADGGFKSGTAFESNDGGNSYDAGFVAGYWEGTGVGTTTVQEVSHGITMEALRPDYFAGEADVHTLAIKTTLGNPVTHKVNTSGNGEPIADSGFYFDGLVNMTAFDEDPNLSLYDDVDNPVKIAVYIQEATNNVGEVTGTNLVVVAKPTAAVPDGRFLCSLGAKKFTEGWHRLTIKAIGNITTAEIPVKAGFVVFIDGKAVNCEDAKLTDANLTMAAADWNENGNLFVSLAETDATVKSVSFDGQGTVDELVFTETAPKFAQDLNIAKVAYNGDAAMNVQYSTNGTDWVDAVGNPFKVAALRGQELPTSITVKWDGKGIYMDQPGVEVTLAAGEQAAIPATAYTLAEATFNGQKYAKLAGAVDAQVENGTLALLRDVEGAIVLTVAGVTVDVGTSTLTYVGEAGGSVIDGAAIITATTGVIDGDVMSVSDLTIEGGSFKGTILADTLTITGGRVMNQPENADLNGKVWSAAVDADGYYTLVDPVTVTFVTAHGKTPDVQKIAPGATAEEPTEPTEEGWTFKHWYTDDDSVAFNFATVITEDTTLNAKWEQDVIHVTDVTLDQDTLTLKVGDADVKLVATVDPDDATDKSVSWMSSADAVATVADDGTVHAVAAGEAIITVTTTDGGKTATCTVTVSAAVQPVVPGEPVNLSPEEAEAQKATLLKAPNLELDGAELTAYQNFFKAVVNPKGDGSVFVFNPEAKNEAGKTLAEQATADAAQALTGNSITVTAVKGLYYGLSEAGALDEMAVTDAQQATGKEITFTPNKKGPAGFWTIIVSDVAIDVPDPE